jgi:hypothetical protein
MARARCQVLLPDGVGDLGSIDRSAFGSVRVALDLRHEGVDHLIGGRRVAGRERPVEVERETEQIQRGVLSVGSRPTPRRGKGSPIQGAVG